jgi:hypothetical protein
MNDDQPDAQGDPVTHLARKPPGYRSYILRCWEAPSSVAGEQADKFRCSLEDPSTGEQRGFASIQALTEFLQNSMTVASTTTHPPEQD